MDRMEVDDFSLFGLLGRSWELGVPVVDLAFDSSDGAVAFVLADGSVAIARIKDSEPAAKRIRISAEDGRSSILPRTKPLPPITRFNVHDHTPVALTAYGKHGFVVGDASGTLTSVTMGGERTPFSRPLDAPIIALDYARSTGALACATADCRVILIRRGEAEPQVLVHGSTIGSLAFSPDHSQLAVAGEDGVTLWQILQKPERIRTLKPSLDPISLAWSPDQTKLALGQEKGGVTVWRLDSNDHITLADYPASVRTLAWTAESNILVTSGAFRTIAWPFNQPKMSSVHPTSIDTGKPSLASIEAIAKHPTRPLIAVGYENGMLILNQIGKPDELLIKTEGHGAISSVKWSSDADHIAVGSNHGFATIIELPAQMFK